MKSTSEETHNKTAVLLIMDFLHIKIAAQLKLVTQLWIEYARKLRPNIKKRSGWATSQTY